MSFAVPQEEKSLLLQQRDEFAKQLGKDPARLFPPGGSGPLPGEQAFKYADVLEKRMKVFESLAAQRESERSELKAELAEWAGIPQQNGSEQTVPDEAQVIISALRPASCTLPSRQPSRKRQMTCSA